MKNKLTLAILLFWTSLLAFFTPFFIARIYMNITGHAKGYAYDLGAEKDISILLGVMELLFWLILCVPTFVSLYKKLRVQKKWVPIAVTVLYLLLATVFILLVIGWKPYLRAFGL